MFFKKWANLSLSKNNAPSSMTALETCSGILCALNVSQADIDTLLDELFLNNVDGLSAFYTTRLSNWTAKIGGEKNLGSYMPAQKAKNDYERINRKLGGLKEKMETAADTVSNYQSTISLFKNLALGAFINCTETQGKVEWVNTLTSASCNLDNFKKLAFPLIEVYQKDINIMLEELDEKCLLDKLKIYIDKSAKEFQQIAQRARKNCHPSDVMIELSDVSTWIKRPGGG